MNHYQGRCHCGAVRFQLHSAPITKGLRCNCSLCERKGAVMSSEVYDRNQLTYKDDNDALACYRFGTGVAKHYFCRQCGIYPFHETLRRPGYFRVNLGCLEGVDSLSLPVEQFDGRHQI